VLSGLERVRVDRTTEAELLKTVPYLARGEYERREGSRVERYYRVTISNEGDLRWVERLAETPLFLLYYRVHPSEGAPFPYNATSRLGFRYVGFGATVAVLDGTVSKVTYGIFPNIETWRPAYPLISVQSVHGFWQHQRMPVSVSSADDESPGYRVSDAFGSLRVVYTPDAPRDLISHLFHLDLGCYWGVRGCVSARDVAPLLWRDKQAIEARAAARLQRQANPCPDWVLAGRVRTLPDLKVELLEVTSSRREAGKELTTSFRLKEVIPGREEGHWTDVPYERFIPSPANPSERIANPVPPFLKAGDRALAFIGAKFDSCWMVPDTPSAESAVRTALPAPRRSDDPLAFVGRF
jgi:hypothetical protein